MATAIQRRRGTTSQHSSFTGLAGEITIDTDKNTIVVHDGSTAGGYALAKYTDVSALGGADITDVVAGSGLTGGATSGSATISLDYSNIAGSLVPSANVTYDLGSLANQWRDIYVGPGSLYVNGTKVLEDSSGTIQFTADNNQNISILTTGSGDLELTSGGDIQLKSDISITATKTISSTGGVKLASNINMDSNNINNLDNPVANQDAATKAYVDATAQTAEEVQDIVGAMFTSNTESGITVAYDDTDGTVDFTVATLNQNTTGSAAQFTTARNISGVAFDGTQNIELNTSHVDEDASNKYYTDERVADKIGAILTGSGNISVTYDDTADTITIAESLTTTDIVEGDNEYHTTARARSAVDHTTGAAGYNSSTGVITIPGTTAHLTEDTNLFYTTERVQDVAGGMSVGGDGLTSTYDDSAGTLTHAVDGTVARLDASATFASDVIVSGNFTVNGTTTTVNTATLAVADNTVVLNSGTTGTPSEDSGIEVERGDLTNVKLQWDESANKWQFTNDGSTYQDILTLAQTRAGISVTDAGGDGSAAYNSSTGVITYTGPSAAEARAHISVTDAGGDGSAAYNSTSGVITYTGPSASETRAHFSASNGVAIASGALSVDATVVRTTGAQTVAGAKTFSDNAIFNGNLTVNGTQTVLNTETLTVDDNLIVLNNNETGTPSADAGIEIERGTSTNVKLQWDESADVWQQTRDGSAWYTLPIESEIKAFFSAADAGGDGSFAYSNGVFTYTGPSAAETRAHLSAGTGMTFSSGAFATTITQYADSDAQGAITVTDAGGDGSLAYSSGTITYTGPSASETRAHFSAGTGINISSGAISLSDTGYVTGVTAGTGLSGGGTSGTVTVNVSGLTVSELAAGSLQISSEAFADNDTSLMTSASIANKIEAYGYSTTTGDITAVVAGTGLNGGATSGSATLTVDSSYITGLFSGGTGITYSSGAISLTDTGYVTGVTAGTLLDGGGTDGTVTLNVDLSELPDMTADVTGSADELVILDGGVQSRKLVSEITLSDFNNDNSWTSNVGDITGVTAGTGLTGGGASGAITLNVNTAAVTNGASTIPTGDHVYDFVTGLGYSTTTGTVTSVAVSAGTGISGGGTVTSSGTISIAFDGNELSTSTTNGDGDHFVVVDDSGNSRKLTKGSIAISGFSNDAGYTTSVGDITGVTAGDYLSGGGASGGVTLNVDATSANTASKVVARDGSGNFAAGVITATATTARYADLAEVYSADADIDAGTVVMFGGDAEVTACGMESCHAVAGVVSTDPAYLMNADAEGVAVALTGRVPTKVTGPVAPGDLMVSSGMSGHAKTDNNAQSGRIIGKAVGSSEGGEAVIEVLINLM